ncbi:MAG: sugar phosphate nucleotidyltransferase [Nanoarchaeota archaeon]|nr:NTP transferase domain-containing protein [Nanoarchaeota archaeon]MBU1632692.1 NTP transferase domain-containing protein [Nanoarchaeota archaeon]MBU1875668.1 NTP transferase domain-containing protein [Nanoarchaeota archaeon]
MKAIILAAGKGTRMLPLTENVPKVLVEVNRKPFLYYVIENLKKAGFDEFGIIVGYLKEKIAEFIESNGINATLIEQKEQLGTGHAVMQAKDFCNDENFIVLGGDNLFSEDDLIMMNNNDEFNYIFGKEISGDLSKYGILITKNNKLIKIVEKPTSFVGNMVNIGLYKFTPDIWDALDKISLSERGEYELTDAISILAREGKVNVLKLKGYWLDLGCKEDIPEVENFIKKII